MTETLGFSLLHHADFSSAVSVKSAETLTGQAGAFLEFVENYSPWAFNLRNDIFLEGLQQIENSLFQDGNNNGLSPMTKSQIAKRFGISGSSLNSNLRTLSAAWRTLHQDSEENPFEPISEEISGKGRLYSAKGLGYSILGLLSTGRWPSQLLDMADKWGLTPAIEVISTWQTAEQIAELIKRPPEEIYATITVLKDEGVFLPGGIRMRTRQNGTGNNNDQRTFSPAGVKLIRKRLDK